MIEPLLIIGIESVGLRKQCRHLFGWRTSGIWRDFECFAFGGVRCDENGKSQGHQIANLVWDYDEFLKGIVFDSI